MAITLYVIKDQYSNWALYHNTNWVRLEEADFNDLLDVEIVSLSNKDLVRYELSTTKWKNTSVLTTTTTTSTTSTTTTTTTTTSTTTTTV